MNPLTPPGRAARRGPRARILDPLLTADGALSRAEHDIAAPESWTGCACRPSAIVRGPRCTPFCVSSSDLRRTGTAPPGVMHTTLDLAAAGRREPHRARVCCALGGARARATRR